MISSWAFLRLLATLRVLASFALNEGIEYENWFCAKLAKTRKVAKMVYTNDCYFSSSFRPAFRLSKFKIALNTRK